MAEVRCLSFHATYQCQRTGVCCASNWPVPVELERQPAIDAAVAAGRVALRAGADAGPFVPAPPDGVRVPGAPTHLLARHDGRCVFLRDAPTACGVHAALGHAALPLACRMFPRVVVVDPRGVSLTLSHYCPTAAAMLERDAPVRIVTDPPAFPRDGEYDGLDAAVAMPPLLRPDMMMDWPAWWDFEARAVDVLVRHPASVGVARLQRVVERLRDWEPRQGPLGGAVRAAFDQVRATPPAPLAPDPEWARARVDEVRAAAPAGARDAHAASPSPGLAPGLTPDAAARRFLAAHAFANWHIQLGQGLEAWLRSVEAAWAFLLMGKSVREADLWLRHLADVNALSQRWSVPRR